jgi:hypothetical protein
MTIPSNDGGAVVSAAAGTLPTTTESGGDDSGMVLPVLIPLETACGWKGRLATTPKKMSPIGSTAALRCPSESTASTESNESTASTSSVGLFARDAMINDAKDPTEIDRYLGGEPSLLPVAVEQEGIADILHALTEAERKQMEAFDMTMPIRHFRAEKVRPILPNIFDLCVVRLETEPCCCRYLSRFDAQFDRETLRKPLLRSKLPCNGESTLEWTLLSIALPWREPVATRPRTKKCAKY